MDVRPSPAADTSRPPSAPLTIPGKVIDWLRLFAEHDADPLLLVGVKQDGTPVVAAVETLKGEKFELRQLLTDVLLRIGSR